MHKLLLSLLLFLALAVPHSAFSHPGDEHDHEHEHDEVTKNSEPALESGLGWRVVRLVEMGNSGKFVHLVLVDHERYTDRTIYSAAINRLCRSEQDFCRIRFWSQERFIPERVALTTEQNQQLRAEYLVNKTAGVNQLRWSCSVNSDRGQCFDH